MAFLCDRQLLWPIKTINLNGFWKFFPLEIVSTFFYFDFSFEDKVFIFFKLVVKDIQASGKGFNRS